MDQKKITIQHTKKWWTLRKILLLVIVCSAITTSLVVVFLKAYKTQEQQQKIPEEIVGNLITLRQMKEEHFYEYYQMFSDDARKNLEFPADMSFGRVVAWLKYEMVESAEGRQLHYLIFDNKDKKLIGSTEIRVKETNKKDDYGQLSAWINEHYRGGGRFQEAFRLINDTYFRLNPKETEYIAHVRLWNQRSYNALKKVGFIDIDYFYENGQKTRYLLQKRKKGGNETYQNSKKIFK
jgi:RimJ/RimL family protein N-acetyltransferase